MKRTFSVSAQWDEDAKVFYTVSDIEGLHIEMRSLDEMEEILFDVAIDLIVANHLTETDLTCTSIRDLIPAIIWHRPDMPSAAA